MGDLVIKADNNLTLFGFSSISWPSGKTVVFCEFFCFKQLRNTCFLKSLHKLAAEQLNHGWEGLLKQQLSPTIYRLQTKENKRLFSV
jgi:hypothetical protein